MTFARLGSNGGVCAFVVRVVFNRREFSFFFFFVVDSSYERG